MMKWGSIATTILVSTQLMASPINRDLIISFATDTQSLKRCIEPTESFEYYEEERLYAYQNQLITRRAYHYLAAFDFFPVIDRFDQIALVCPAIEKAEAVAPAEITLE
jgi:hypothetical protein